MVNLKRVDFAQWWRCVGWCVGIFCVEIFTLFGVWQTRCSRGCPTNTFVIHSLSQSLTLFLNCLYNQRGWHSITSHCPISPVRARELKFWQKFHLPPLSRVRCHVSHVTFHMSGDMCHFSFFSFFLGKGGDVSWWRVCHQRGYSV